MENLLSLEKFKVHSNDPLKQAVSNRLPRHNSGEKFLQGPIPLNWLNTAGSLPGHALHVGIGLWFLAGLKKSNPIHTSPQIFRDLGVKRQAVYRALKNLMAAGLIEYKPERGKSPTVKILDTPHFHKESE